MAKRSFQDMPKMINLRDGEVPKLTEAEKEKWRENNKRIAAKRAETNQKRMLWDLKHKRK